MVKQHLIVAVVGGGARFNYFIYLICFVFQSSKVSLERKREKVKTFKFLPIHFEIKRKT